MINILSRITELRLSHNWTEYQLAQRAGLPQSTISSWYRKEMLPTLQSLEKICNAFDMTMAQFLAEDDNLTEITSDQKELLHKWELLSSKQKKAFLELMSSITFQ
jgi:transcriptional regulator with XRE-family HTH domain